MELRNTEILIDNDTLLKDIQSAFSVMYPFLMLEFVQANRLGDSGTALKPGLRAAIKDLVNLPKAQSLDLNKDRVVSELLAELKIRFGLFARMCRKSGNVWNAISLTDGWTLENQNAAGKFISSEMEKPMS